MSISFLDKYDDRTAEGILAAAALSTGYFATDDDQPAILKKFSREAENLLNEVRQRLHIDDSDKSLEARASIDKFLVKEISDRVLTGSAAQEALNRAGQSGRVPPSLYTVVQPKTFLKRFIPLGIRPPHVEDAVKRPDDFQHLLASEQAEEKNTLSLFLKTIASKNKLPHWLLVQTVRQGLSQNVQSAWRIFPNDVDLSRAEMPLDVLKAFVFKFGVPVHIENERGKFIESIHVDRDRTRLVQQIQNAANDHDYFQSVSWSRAIDGSVEVGIGYCIDLSTYRAYLAKNKALS